jgi:hypothetical protein
MTEGQSSSCILPPVGIVPVPNNEQSQITDKSSAILTSSEHSMVSPLDE